MNAIILAALLILGGAQHGCSGFWKKSSEARAQTSTLEMPLSEEHSAKLYESLSFNCKDFSRPAPDGYNTCSVKKCTDGKIQWDSGPETCSDFKLPKRLNVKPFDKELWEKK